MTERDDRTTARWPARLGDERPTTSLGRGARVGLATTAAVLTALLGVAWTGAVPTPTGGQDSAPGSAPTSLPR